jgi:hypothetical protein
MNEQLKLTPIDEIEDMADGVPVLAVEGTVKYAQEVKTGTSAQGHAWDKQFFVLTNGTVEIACTMWNATDNELKQGERVLIVNTQNKKGEWKGMVKGSYQKNGERKHTLEIRANQVKITNQDTTQNNAKQDYGPIPDPDWPEAERPKCAPNLFKEYAGHAGRAFAAAWEQSKESMALIPAKDAEELSVFEWLDLRLRIAQGLAIEINKIIRKERF